MLKTIRYIIFYPFSLLYGLVTMIRNYLFDKGFLKSAGFDIPVLSIGNLTVGGTGKTPHTEYVLSLLQDKYKLAVLSRGYKRKTKGFLVADKNCSAQDIGDEPYQMHIKFPGVIVAVDEKRVDGVEKLLMQYPDLQGIVLDDAYQHRYIKPGLSLLLTDYNRLYTRDFYLPSGRLRESKKGSRRADIILVTKCPAGITLDEMQHIRGELNINKTQELYFSTFVYKSLNPVFPAFTDGKQTISLSGDPHVFLMAGIVSPTPIIEYLRNFTSYITTFFFPDHHDFTLHDFNQLQEKFDAVNTQQKIIVVTEKDAARLLLNPDYPEKLKALTFALPIEVRILNEKGMLFNERIEHYVAKNTRNS